MDVTFEARLAGRLPDAVAVVDEAGTLKWANAAAERLLAVRIGPLVGTSALPFVHPEDLGLVAASLTSIRDKDVGTPIELRVRCPEGWRLVEVVGANLLADPAVAGIVLCMRDLTERRRWEVAGNQESRFRALVHNAATILMLLDAEGRVESVSAAITRLLGHDQELVEGHRLVEFVDPSDRANLENAVACAAAGPHEGGRRTTLEVGLLRADGAGSVPFELHVVNLLDDPTTRGLVVSAHDVTELRRSLDELARAEAELLRQAQLAAVGQLASMIGHELRNPLSAVTNSHFLIRQTLERQAGGEDIDPVLARQLSLAEREMRRALKLAEDLMSYVRPRRPRPEPVPVQSLVEEVIEATPPPAHVELVTELESVTVIADSGHLHEMLANLLTNAYQAMGDSGTVRVRACRSGERLVLTVSDEGTGIDGSEAERLFEPFFSTKTSGTGLGLAIVRRLAEAHGGVVHIANGEGRGAVATVCLPLEAQLAAS